MTTSKYSEPEMIGFLMIPQFSMIAFSAAIEPLRLANYLSGQELYRWVLISRDGGLEKASNGIDVRIDYALADHRRCRPSSCAAGLTGTGTMTGK